MSNDIFKPALRLSSLNQVYDFLTIWFFRHSSFYKAFLEVGKNLRTQPNSQLLELGCGPARLAIRIKKKFPRARITAVDRDPAILQLARKNAKAAKVTIDFKEQDISNLSLKGPYDRIYSTLAFHHLSIPAKERTIKSVSRLLKDDGQFVLADFCGSSGLMDRLQFLLVQLVDGFDTTSSHAQGWLESSLPKYFSRVETKLKVSTLLGPVGVFVCHP